MCYNKHINKQNKGFIMTAVKITTTIPSQLKEQLVQLKDEMHLSMATIYKEALEQYLERKEIEKWEIAGEKASKDKEYLMLCRELGETGGEVYEN